MAGGWEGNRGWVGGRAGGDGRQLEGGQTPARTVWTSYESKKCQP